MAKSLVLLLTGVAIGVAAFATNPSPDQHRDKIKKAVAERSQLEGALGVGHVTAFASKYHSLGVASYTTVNDKLRTVGALGLVFAAD